MSVKTSHVVIGLVLAAGTAGLMVGTRGTRKTAEKRLDTLLARAEARPQAASHPDAAVVGPAVRWADMPGTARGPNATFTNHLGALVQNAPAPETLDGRAERLAATRDARAERRAFDGAPPRIPHAIDERTTSACIACHGTGLVIPAPGGDRIAPQMSHPVYQNCTQCHVPEQRADADRPPFRPATIEHATSPEDNTFAGLSPHPGLRYLPGSPPVMPHPRWMRETCASCHGPLGPPGLRTTHPERPSCEQCHAPSPSLVQEVFFP